MWKGLKKALGKPGKAKKSSYDKYGLDVSNRSTASAAPSSVVFPLDLDAEAYAALQDQRSEHKHIHLHLSDVKPAGPLSAAQLQQHIQQQLALQKLAQPADDLSVSKRRATAMQKRIDNAMLNPSTCLYQIGSLLSLSTLFEHKLQRDAMTALQQTPDSLVSKAAAAAAAAAFSVASRGQQSCSCERSAVGPSAGVSEGSCSFCGATALQRTPSATAASTAHVALQLVRWGYRVIVRKVLHSKAYWTKAMDNTFIVALDTSSGSHVEYIVDPHFRETFNVGVMSDNYSAVWHSLPHVFIGMPCQLQPVVQLLCEEMELSFLEAGRPCPPWREWAATINRWMSDQYVDIIVPEPDAADEEVIEFITRCCQVTGTSVAAAGGSSTSATTASTAVSTCSPVALNQYRLQDKMHVSSVLSSASTCSKRPVQEPLHKQMGFAAVTEDEALLPITLRDASFTSVSSEASAASTQMLIELQAAEAAAGKCNNLMIGGGQSLSVPSAEILSSSEGSSTAGRESLIAERVSCEASGPQQQQQQQPQAASNQPESTQEPQQPPAEIESRHERTSSSGSSSAAAAAAAADGLVPAPRQKSKSLLTEHLQLRSRLQQKNQQRLLFPCADSNHYVQQIAQPGYQLQLQALQQQQQVLQQQQLLQQQHIPHQQQLLQLQLQQHQQQLLRQQVVLQQQQLLQQQQQQAQVVVVQSMQQPQQQQKQRPMQQSQQQLAPLLPVVHTVRPCGSAHPPSTSALSQQQHRQQQQMLAQQPWDEQMQAMQPAVQQDQPKLLRLIHRNK